MDETTAVVALAAVLSLVVGALACPYAVARWAERLRGWACGFLGRARERARLRTAAALLDLGKPPDALPRGAQGAAAGEEALGTAGAAARAGSGGLASGRRAGRRGHAGGAPRRVARAGGQPVEDARPLLRGPPSPATGTPGGTGTRLHAVVARREPAVPGLPGAIDHERGALAGAGPARLPRQATTPGAGRSLPGRGRPRRHEAARRRRATPSPRGVSPGRSPSPVRTLLPAVSGRAAPGARGPIPRVPGSSPPIRPREKEAHRAPILPLPRNAVSPKV